MHEFEYYWMYCFWLDGALVQNISQKAKNPDRWSKFPLHKNFKLSLDQNVTEQT